MHLVGISTESYYNARIREYQKALFLSVFVNWVYFNVCLTVN
jgi:hypothetical protein